VSQYSIMHTNGTLISYDGTGEAVWVCDSYPCEGAYLEVLDTGNIVIQAPGELKWCTWDSSLNGYKLPLVIKETTSLLHLSFPDLRIDVKLSVSRFALLPMTLCNCITLLI
jgi:hypothetical protein